jgi:hypothetical protein
MMSHRFRIRVRCSPLRLEELEARRLLSGYQPTANEQLLLEELNDIRANPAAFGAAIGVDLSNVAPAQPLAFSPLLIQAAQQHAQDMSDRDYVGQDTPDGLTLAQRIASAGFAGVSWGESSLAGLAYPTPAAALETLITDAGVSSLADRNQLLATSALFQPQGQVGIGIVQWGSGPLTNYYTIDTAAGSDSRAFLTGVVYGDTNGNGQYDAGEGLAGVTVTVAGAGTTTSFDSGGYALPLSPGTYTVTASGGGLATPLVQTVTVGTSNVRLNFVAPPSTTQPSDTAWIKLLFHDLLNRVPGTSELNAWLAMLQNGATHADAAAGFLHSDEYTDRLVTTWYETYLHRAPDAGGLENFCALLQSGTSESAVRTLFLTSPEYYATHGGTAAGFVQGLYQELLGRTPVGNEAASWIAAASDPSTAVHGVLASTEFWTDEVDAFYAAFLRRAADADGQSFFYSLLAAGQDERDVLPQFFTSTEYQNGASNVLWLQSVYQDVLGRTADGADQLGGWLALLNDQGLSRTVVANDILTSPESENREVAALAEQFLGQAPDAPTLSGLVGQLQTSGRLSDVRASLLASADYFNQQGATSTGYVQALYRDLLNRSPSAAEVQVWVGQLQNGATRLQVAAAFLASLEYQDQLVQGLYVTYLGRFPTDAELTLEISLLQSTGTEADVAATLIGSGEYLAQRLATTAPVDGDAVISAPSGSSTIVLTTSSRTAGAISSLTWNGKEFIDSTDHGRELQSAVNLDDGQPLLPEVYNPTEAGSARDGQGPTSSSHLLFLHADGSQLESATQMAFWLAPGQRSGGALAGNLARNQTVLSNIIVSKRVQLGYDALPGVISYDVTFTLPPGEPHTRAVFEALTGYMPAEFARYWQYDIPTGTLAPLTDGPGEQPAPIVFSTNDGAYAMGIYSPPPSSPPPGLSAPSYARHRFSDQQVNKWSCIYHLDNPNGIAPGSYSFQMFVAVGTLQDVKADLGVLASQFTHG